MERYQIKLILKLTFAKKKKKKKKKQCMRISEHRNILSGKIRYI